MFDGMLPRGGLAVAGALARGCVVSWRERDTRQKFAIVWRTMAGELLVVPVTEITGRPAETEVPLRHAAHRSEVLLCAADRAECRLPMRRAIIRVDRMRRCGPEQTGRWAVVAIAPRGLMHRIDSAVRREVDASRIEDGRGPRP